MKESDNIELKNSSFQWKYPLWYAKDIVADNCRWAEMARAGVWYTDNLLVRDTLIEAPKNFRRLRILHYQILCFQMQLKLCGTVMELLWKGKCKR